MVLCVLHTTRSDPAPRQHMQILSCAIPNLLQCSLPSSQLPWFHLVPGGPGVVLMLLAPCFAGGVSSHAAGKRRPTEDRSDAERVAGAERLTGSSGAQVQPFWLVGMR